MSHIIKLFFYLYYFLQRLIRRNKRKILSDGQYYINTKGINLSFFTGVNLPWISYGNDFGVNPWNKKAGLSREDNRAILENIFDKLNAKRVEIVRWFIFCDGRSGIVYDNEGIPIYVDKYLFNDIDAAIEVAEKNKIKIMFVLFDFLWFKEALVVKGVRLRGGEDIIKHQKKLKAIINNIIKPLFDRYGNSDTIIAWDIINEPEWVTNGYKKYIYGKGISFLRMRYFIKEMVKMIHNNTRQLATVGLANIDGIPLVIGSNLDFYQFHWYDRWQNKLSLERHVSFFGLDKPLLLGEFPTKNSMHSPDKIVTLAKQSGYCGAIAWSALANDPFSGI